MSKLPGDLSESEIARACRVGRWPISIDLQMPCTSLRFSRGLAELCSSHQTTRAGLREIEPKTTAVVIPHAS